MSDASQGPGWWQASDGKWYAPELHPDYRPPTVPTAPAPPPTPTPPIAAPPTAPFPAGPTVPPPAAPPVGPSVGPATFPESPSPGRGGNARWIAIAVVVLIVVAVGVIVARRDSGSSTSSGSFCEQAKVLANDASLDEAFSDPSKVDIAVARFDSLVKASPSEIRADMQVLSDTLHKVANALKSAGDNSESQFAAMMAIVFTLDQAKIEAATGRIDTYTQDKCGFKLSTDSSS
jgi:hypothetical protein